MSTEDGEDKEKVKKAGECCKNILNHVNQAVKEAENKQVKTLTESKSNTGGTVFTEFDLITDVFAIYRG